MKHETNTRQPHAGGLQANGNYTLHVWDSIGDCPPSQAYININYNSCCEVNDPFITYEEFDLIQDDKHLLNEFYIPKYQHTYSINRMLYFANRF